MITTKNKRSVPVNVKPYEHQINAFNFVIDIFGVDKGCDANLLLKRNIGAALLAEM